MENYLTLIIAHCLSTSALTLELLNSLFADYTVIQKPSYMLRSVYIRSPSRLLNYGLAICSDAIMDRNSM